MPRYEVELLQPMISVKLEAASDEEARWLAIETFREYVKTAPMRVTEIQDKP